MPEKVDTNVDEQQVDTSTEEVVDQTTEQEEATSTNADEAVSQEEAYNKAFEEIDLDNPDMSLFAKETNVEDEPEQTIESNEIEEETTVITDPFAVDDDGYLMQSLVDRGKEIKVTPEELFAFGNKGVNYESKNAEIKQYKDYINVLKRNSNISIEDLTSLADLSNGNKDALKHLISKYEVDVYDVDSNEEKYTPDTNEYSINPVDEIWSDYQKQNEKGSEVVAEAFNSMDEGFRQEVYNEQTFPSFIDDVSKGIFDKLYPETAKIKSLHPEATWLQAYAEANKRYNSRSTSKKQEVPTNVNTPRDQSTSHTINSKAKADAVWDDPEVFNRMMNEQLSL